jgi:uncharacterized protein YoxC
MPLTALWSLIVSLILLALGLSLKLAYVSHLLKLADKELDGFIKQIAVLKEKHEKTISRSSQFQLAEMPKIIEEYETQINILAKKADEVKKPIGIWAEIYRQHLHNK